MARANARRCECGGLARALLYLSQGGNPTVTTMTEIDSENETFETPTKGSARRRVDAYHEALRERAAMRELEQLFVLDANIRPQGRY